MSLNLDTESRVEIVRQWIPQSNLFEQHDYTTICNLLIFLILSQSHHTKFTYFKYNATIHYFFIFSQL